jgi:energy-coupling factor transporter ATP-binding protein EcfA2
MNTRGTATRGATRKATRGVVRGSREGGRELRVRAIFGLGFVGPGARRALLFRDPPALGPGVTLVHGPSGSGKTTLLRALARACRREGSAVREVGWLPASSRSVVGCSRRGLRAWLRTLASCGLAEASLLVRRASTLSAGESFRLSLALALEWAREGKRGGGGGCVLIVDEACAVLDDATACGVCRTLRRVASSSPGLRVVVASASPRRLERALGADREIELCLGGVSPCMPRTPRGAGMSCAEIDHEKEGS